MTDPAGNTHVAVGVYREVQRPVRLVFTWDWDNPANRVGETLVSVEFKVLGEKQTEVVLTHEGFADSARIRRHEQGWTELLRLLEGFIGDISGQGGKHHDDERYDCRLFQPSQRPSGVGIVPGRRRGLYQLHDSRETADRPRGVFQSTKRFYSMIRGLEVSTVIVDGDNACA